MNNTSITKFRWSQKTDSILNKLGIFTIADFEGISLKALKEMGIPEKTIKQIEDICKVHNIKTKETELMLYTIEFDYERKVNLPAPQDIYVKVNKMTCKYIATDIESIKNDILQYCEDNEYLCTDFTVVTIQLLPDTYRINTFELVNTGISFYRTIKKGETKQ